jgi:hypothetical protein
MVTDALLNVTRGQRKKKHGAVWGALKSDADRAADLREVIAFETARLMKGANDPKYNVNNHRSDFNDNYLCAYLAVGYTLVTEDRGIRSDIITGGCPEPRVVDVGQAVEIAEAFLESRRAT